MSAELRGRTEKTEIAANYNEIATLARDVGTITDFRNPFHGRIRKRNVRTRTVLLLATVARRRTAIASHRTGTNDNWWLDNNDLLRERNK